MSEELAALRQRLAAREAATFEPDARGHASVAAILRSAETNLELLFVLRARRDGDPWSGDIGFPGGRVEPRDASARETAERETHEEIGLTLPGTAYLGRLDDVRGTSRSILVSAFVYHVAGAVGTSSTFGPEIAEAFWIPASVLLDPSRHTSRRYARGGDEVSLPAIRLLEPHHPLLWGLTYRIVEQLVRLMGHNLPVPPSFDAPPVPRAAAPP